MPQATATRVTIYVVTILHHCNPFAGDPLC